jgi:NAD(P)H-dependent flavin oxidoreductase YrpB (nitropropane dioxygenase family)
MGLSTRLTEEYGLDVPLVSAGMAFISRAPLAAAVSRAGALGTLGASAMPPDLLLREVAEIRETTDRPFAVNVIPRFGTDALITAVAQARVPVATFFWDEPPAAWVRTLADAGTRVWMQVGSPAEARSAVALGADALVVQGAEAGGHNRSVAATMTLVPAVADAVGVPVVAAGGIADGRGLAAVLALGAAGALLGTRFLMSEEADASAGYQERIAGAGVGDTARHNVFGIDFPDATVRGLRNAIVTEHEGRDQPAPYASLDPQALPVIGTTSVLGQEIPLQRFNGLPPVRATQGDLDQMSLLAGETAGLIDGVEPAGDIVRRIAQEAEGLLGSRYLDGL